MNARLALLLPVLALGASGNNENTDRVVGELASDRIELAAESVEPLVEILVAEGETVEAGQVLIRQDAARAQARLAEAEAFVDQARARLDELVRGPRSEQIAAARANAAGAADELAFREAEFERVREIHARELASPELLDRAKAALDTARAQLALRRAQLEEVLAGTTVEELAQAEAALAQAEARRDLAQVDLDRHTLVAPVDGVVDSRLFEIGEKPMPGQALLILLAGEQPYARVYIPETIRVHLQPGIEAQVIVDGLAEPVPGIVRWVSSEAAFTPYFALTERDRGRLTFEAKIDIERQDDRLPDGVPVKVRFPALGTVR